MFSEKDTLLATMQTRKALLMMDGKFSAAQLYQEIMKTIGFMSRIPKGEPGKTPVRGKDYFTPVDVDAMVADVLKRIPIPSNGKTPIAEKDYPSRPQVEGYIRAQVAKIRIPTPEPGYTPRRGVDFWTSADIDIMANTVLERLSSGELRSKLESLTGEDRLDASAIKNLPQAMGAVNTRTIPELFFGRRGSSGGGGGAIQVRINGVNIGQDIKRLDFAGAGVAVERLGDGNAIITIAGATAANLITEAVPSSGVSESGSNVVLDFSKITHTPVAIQFITRQGQVQPTASGAPADGSSAVNINGTTNATVYNADITETFLVCYTY